MSIAIFLLLGFIFVISFSLSVRDSMRGAGLFVSILVAAVSGFFILLNVLSLLEQVDLLTILILVVLGVLLVLFLAKMKIRMY